MKMTKRNWSILGLLGIAVMIVYCLYLLHTGDAQRMIASVRQWGFVGMVVITLFQSLSNMLPIPGEFIAVVILEIYGPITGGLILWISGLLGAVAGYYLTWWLAKPLLNHRMDPYLHKMEQWLANHEHKGLLLVRFVPLIPYHFVNYAAGILKAGMWSFIWTTSLGILPHTVAMSVLYAGFRKGSMTWGLIGCAIFLLLAGMAWFLKKRTSKAALKAN
ncbi:VTT domain-containing protein [Paenibacillus chibensis]|uniref:TVP38/TMEM64 family protein n=2 Tax=Paenibacillus chibensis TaxID=59846 RepID=UPI000FDA788E